MVVFAPLRIGLMVRNVKEPEFDSGVDAFQPDASRLRVGRGGEFGNARRHRRRDRGGGRRPHEDADCVR